MAKQPPRLPVEPTLYDTAEVADMLMAHFEVQHVEVITPSPAHDDPAVARVKLSNGQEFFVTVEPCIWHKGTIAVDAKFPGRETTDQPRRPAIIAVFGMEDGT